MSQRYLPHIITYDIANPKRLIKVHRYLKKIALPLQYSVFLMELNTNKRTQVLSDLEKLIHPRQDDVRIYPLPAQPEWVKLGKAFWHEDMQVTGLNLPTELKYAELPKVSRHQTS